ncbi:MAG: glycosyltransferase family 4 protein, partial [Planctomycetota bacterium]
LQFDVVHQLTMCGFREPGYLWRLGVPFVWGPVGGTQNYPWRLLPRAGLKTMLVEGLRSVANVLQFRLSSRVRRAARRAAPLLTANSEGRRAFRTVHGMDAVPELDVGVEALVAPPPGGGDADDGPLRLVWNGSLIPRKALHLLIEALALLPAEHAYGLTVVGSGPLEPRLRRLARRRGVGEHIRWLGRVPFQEAMAEYGRAHVLAFTSCRDTCGNQVLEALGRGVPVICLDHQGAGDVVTERCGIKVPVGDFDAVVAGLRDAIIALERDRERLRKLSEGALERAADFLWERKGERMAGFYRRAAREGVGTRTG